MMRRLVTLPFRVTGIRDHLLLSAPVTATVKVICNLLVLTAL